MTITANVPVREDIENWRDEMIALAHKCFDEYTNDRIVRTDEITIVANALDDIRVRDVLLYDIAQLDEGALIYTFFMILEAMNVIPDNHQHSVVTFGSFILLLRGRVVEAMEGLQFAVEGKNNGLARMMYLTTLVLGDKAQEIARSVFNDMTRHTARYGPTQ